MSVFLYALRGDTRPGYISGGGGGGGGGGRRGLRVSVESFVGLGVLLALGFSQVLRMF